MDIQDILTKEEAETKKRIAKLKGTKILEELREEVLNYERDLSTLTRPPIFGWIRRLFKKGR